MESPRDMTLGTQVAPRAIGNLETFDAYLQSLTSPIDSFLEDLILDSRPHAILLDGQEIGSLTLNDDRLLTQFYLVPSARGESQRIFAHIRSLLPVKGAIVPTCDEFLLGLALDDFTEIDKGAYFFIEDERPVPSDVSNGMLYRPAVSTDLEEIRAISGDFLEDPAVELREGQLHVGHLGNQMVALGLIVPGRLQESCASLGIFTREDHRRQGIAGRTLAYLRTLCHETGLRPVAGCWYYNEASKRSLESAGMIVSSRLLRILFSEEPETPAC